VSAYIQDEQIQQDAAPWLMTSMSISVVLLRAAQNNLGKWINCTEPENDDLAERAMM